MEGWAALVLSELTRHRTAKDHGMMLRQERDKKAGWVYKQSP